MFRGDERIRRLAKRPDTADDVTRIRAATPPGGQDVRAYGSYWNRVFEQWGARRLDEPTPSEIKQLVAYIRANTVPRPQRPRRARRRSAVFSFALGMAGQVAFRRMEQDRITRAPWAITTLGSCLPVLVLGTALAHMLHEDAAAAVRAQTDALGPTTRVLPTRSPDEQSEDQPNQNPPDRTGPPPRQVVLRVDGHRRVPRCLDNNVRVMDCLQHCLETGNAKVREDRLADFRPTAMRKARKKSWPGCRFGTRTFVVNVRAVVRAAREQRSLRWRCT